MRELEGEIRERTVKGRQVVGALERVMKGRNVSMAVKRGIRKATKRSKKKEKGVKTAEAYNECTTTRKIAK